MSLQDIYNIEAIVNYSECENENENENTQYDNCDMKYREQLKEVFFITNTSKETNAQIDINDEDTITTTIQERIDALNDIITKNYISLLSESQKETFETILITLASKLMTEDRTVGFLLLFCYDYFSLIHTFIVSLVVNATVNDKILYELKNKICN